ncbi:MAG: AEC family transporter [Rhodobacteraceae bacterium]|nr:AEC family transporter [Paracoccaceae bacterium]
MAGLLQITLPVFLLIGFGYAAVRAGFFADTAVDGLMRFAQNFAVPCLLFMAIAGLDLGQTFEAPLLATYYLATAAVFGLGALGARAWLRRPGEDAVAIGFAAFFANSVLLGLPITQRAYGAEVLAFNFAIVAVHAPICYAIGITAMEVLRNRGGGLMRTGRAVLRAMFSNALMLGILGGFAVNLSGLPLPGVLDEALRMMIAAALPAALFGLGGVLTRYRPEGDLRAIAMVVTLALVVQPGLVWVLGTQVFDLAEAPLRAAVLTASMAPGVNTYLFAFLYGRAMRVAAASILIGTAASVLSVTFWLWLLG